MLQERRLAAIRELVRLLKTGGQALIYVWAFEQEYNKQRSKYLKEQSKDTYSTTNSAPTGQDLREGALPPEDAHNSVANVQCISKRSGMKLSIHTNRTAFKTQDLLVPWHLKDEKTQRGEYSAEDLENQKTDDKKASSGNGLCSVNGSDSTPGSDSKMCVGSRVGISSESGTSSDREPECIVPVYHRYYHLFQQGELEQLCAQISGVRVQSSYHDQGNWCLILEKTA